jgi:uncharacterized membrane protein YphA (DoxX/SURF4 family)
MSPLWIAVSIVYAPMWLAPAAMKLAGTAKMRTAADHFGIAWPCSRVLGLFELAAAAGVLTGLWWRPVGLIAAIGMVVLLVGAIVTHRRSGDDAGEYVPAVVFLAASGLYLGVGVMA